MWVLKSTSFTWIWFIFPLTHTVFRQCLMKQTYRLDHVSDEHHSELSQNDQRLSQFPDLLFVVWATTTISHTWSAAIIVLQSFSLRSSVFAVLISGCWLVWIRESAEWIKFKFKLLLEISSFSASYFSYLKSLHFTQHCHSVSPHCHLLISSTLHVCPSWKWDPHLSQCSTHKTQKE